MTGRLIAIVGPSGAGKDTLLAGLLALRPDLVLARRAITRPDDAGGEDHEAVTEAQFAARVAAGDFLFHWHAHGLGYGVPRGLLWPLENGRTVLFNGSRAAIPAARTARPDLRVVMVTAPTPILAARLAARGREAPDDIAERLARAQMDPPDGALVVVNDSTLDAGVARLDAAITLAAAAR